MNEVGNRARLQVGGVLACFGFSGAQRVLFFFLFFFFFFFLVGEFSQLGEFFKENDHKKKN